MTRIQINEFIARHDLTDLSTITRLIINIENDVYNQLEKIPLDTRVDEVEKLIKRIFTRYISEIIKEETKKK